MRRTRAVRLIGAFQAPLLDEQGGGREHDPRNEHGETGEQQQVIQDAGDHCSLPYAAPTQALPAPIASELRQARWAGRFLRTSEQYPRRGAGPNWRLAGAIKGFAGTVLFRAICPNFEFRSVLIKPGTSKNRFTTPHQLREETPKEDG